MIGAALAGILYMLFKKDIAAFVGEVFGTSVLGGICAYFVAKLFLSSDSAAVFGYVLPFFVSTIVGSIIAYLVIKQLRLMKVLKGVMSDDPDKPLILPEITEYEEKIRVYRAAIFKEKPVIHHITTFVTIYQCARITAFLGAAPIMAFAPEETTQITAKADALVVNTGTLNNTVMASIPSHLSTPAAITSRWFLTRWVPASHPTALILSASFLTPFILT